MSTVPSFQNITYNGFHSTDTNVYTIQYCTELFKNLSNIIDFQNKKIEENKIMIEKLYEISKGHNKAIELLNKNILKVVSVIEK